MKMKNILLSALALSFALTSCNEWLDVMPDNRAEVDTAEKVEKLLVSAYPENAYIMLTELSSDNVDDFGENNAYQRRIDVEAFQWADITESDNEDPKNVWGSLYGAITNANQAIVAINEMGATTPELKASLGEALLCKRGEDAGISGHSSRRGERNGAYERHRRQRSASHRRGRAEGRIRGMPSLCQHLQSAP